MILAQCFSDLDSAEEDTSNRQDCLNVAQKGVERIVALVLLLHLSRALGLVVVVVGQKAGQAAPALGPGTALVPEGPARQNDRIVLQGGRRICQNQSRGSRGIGRR